MLIQHHNANASQTPLPHTANVKLTEYTSSQHCLIPPLHAPNAPPPICTHPCEPGPHLLATAPDQQGRTTCTWVLASSVFAASSLGKRPNASATCGGGTSQGVKSLNHTPQLPWQAHTLLVSSRTLRTICSYVSRPAPYGFSHSASSSGPVPAPVSSSSSSLQKKRQRRQPQRTPPHGEPRAHTATYAITSSLKSFAAFWACSRSDCTTVSRDAFTSSAAEVTWDSKSATRAFNAASTGSTVLPCQPARDESEPTASTTTPSPPTYVCRRPVAVPSAPRGCGRCCGTWI